MKVTKEQSAANRKALVDAAARLYRERGIAGVGLAEISREAGFTHGGFYGRFASKEELAAEACGEAFGVSMARLEAQLTRHDGDLTALLKRYFSAAHRDAPGAGCPMATLGVDAAREGGLLGQAMSDGIAGYLRAMASHRPDGTVLEQPTADDEARAIRTLTTMIGGVILARACAEAAPAMSDRILRTSLATTLASLSGASAAG
ncbi:TetR/AcrR family transcriptional regulator [Roseateles aquatilis]|nr:TetR/AcrR family transcriptional regulator [Roseateles aquatilis]